MFLLDPLLIKFYLAPLVGVDTTINKDEKVAKNSRAKVPPHLVKRL